MIYYCDKCGTQVNSQMNICANCGNELIWLEDGTLEGNQFEPLKNRKRARSNGVKKIPVKDIIIGAMFLILGVSILYKDNKCFGC